MAEDIKRGWVDWERARHFWTDVRYVTTFFRVDVARDAVRMDDEHDEYMWVSELPAYAHPLVREMAERAGIFEK